MMVGIHKHVIIVTMFVSLDGVTESPEKWSLKFWNDDISKFKHDELFPVHADGLRPGASAESWTRRRTSYAWPRSDGCPLYCVSF